MRLFLTFAIFLNITVVLKAQVYHFETGKVIPGDEPGLYNFREGVFNSYPAEYSVLLVYENSKVRKSRLISIPVIRIKALNRDSCSSPIFILYGGPGESNLKKDFLHNELIKNHDLIIVGYRGVDGQVKLDCPQIKDALLNYNTNYDSEKYFSDAFSNCINNLQQKGIDISAFTITEVVNDIFEAKQAFGYDKISFLAFSYGTILAQQFAQKFPEQTDKLLLIGARPLNNLVIDGNVFNKQFLKYIDYYLPNLKSSYPDSLIRLEYFKSKFDLLSTQNESINQFALSLFTFSQLYTLNVVDDFLKILADSTKSSTKHLIELYHEFYKKYPGDVLLGDMYLKKQGRIQCDSLLLEGNSFGEQIARELNNWYSPHNGLLCCDKKMKLDTLAHKTLFISGELDIASPPNVLKQIRPFFTNSKCVNLPKTSHLDLFFEQKPVVDSLIFNFYCN